MNRMLAVAVFPTTRERQRRSQERSKSGGAGAAYTATGLQPTQSLSVVVTWPSGIVKKPSFGIWNRDKWYLAAPTALCLYYFFVWLAVGRPPKPGTIVVRYEPPAGISPAAARYLITTGSDGRTLAAVIAALAARNCLSVEPHDGMYKLTRLASNPSEESKLAPEEGYALNYLFEDGPITEISPSMSQENSARNSRYVANIQQDLAERFDGIYFTRHIGYVAVGVLATFAVAFSLAATVQGRDTGGTFFMTAWILFCALGLGAIVETARAACLEGSPARYGGMDQTAAGDRSCRGFHFLLRSIAREASARRLSCIRLDGGYACIGQPHLGAVSQTHDARRRAQPSTRSRGFVNFLYR